MPRSDAQHALPDVNENLKLSSVIRMEEQLTVIRQVHLPVLQLSKPRGVRVW